MLLILLEIEKNFVQISTILALFNKLKSEQNSQYISGNIKSTKKPDHILEKPGLVEFCGYFFKNQTRESRLTTECHK